MKRPRDFRVLGLLGLAAFLAGMVASLTHGTLRNLGQLALLLLGLAMAWHVSRRSEEVEATGALGGSGYGEDARTPVVVRWLHGTVALLYNAGLMTVVLAFLVRVRVVPVRFDDALVQAYPFLLGTFLLLLSVSVGLSVRELGGVLGAWYTRVHGGAVAMVGTLVALAAVLLVVGDGLRVGDVVLRDNDLPVLVTVGVLGVSTQMFLAAGLPTVLDMAQAVVNAVRHQRHRRRTAPAATPPFVYAGVLALAVAAVLAYLANRFDVFGGLGGLFDERVVYVVAVVPLALALFFLASAVGLYRESRRGLYAKRVGPDLRTRILVLGLSSLAGLFWMTLLVIHLEGGLNSLGPFSTGRNVTKDLTAFTILSTAGPIGFYLHRQNRRLDAIESRLPDFLNDLAESRRAGLTLAAGLQVAARSDYGALSVEVRKMATQVSWGVPFNDALRLFADRVKTRLVRRSVQIIIEATRSGGSISQVLKTSARDAHELKSLEADRRATMTTFLVVIYVVFFVFILVLAALDTQFIPQVLEASEVARDSDVGFPLAESIDAESINLIYYNAAMVQAIGNGLVGGVLAEGRVTSGFRHVAFMAFTAWVSFRFLLAGF